MSRCWDVANFVPWTWWCPLVVFVAGVRSRGVRVVEFGTKRLKARGRQQSRGRRR